MHDDSPTKPPVTTEQIAAALRKSEERFRQVVESAPNAMVMINQRGIDRDGQRAGRASVRLCSRGDARAAHRDAGAACGFAATIPTCAARSFDDPVSRPMGAGRDLFGLKKDGSEFPVEIGLNPIETEDGHDGALRHRRHHVAQTARGTVPSGRRIGAERDGDDQPARPDRDGQCAGRAGLRLRPRRDARAVDRDAGPGALSRQPSEPARRRSFTIRRRGPWAPGAICTG